MRSRTAEWAETITRGTGNVFADLGFPDAAERQARLRLAYVVNHVLGFNWLPNAVTRAFKRSSNSARQP
jgi:hypothetical protein